MIKLLISGGDSFTFGSELNDDVFGDAPQPSEFSWANLVANKLNVKHINIAIGGRGNSFIVRHVIHVLNKSLLLLKPQEIFVQIMWTFTPRQEIHINEDTQRKDSPWFSIDPYIVDNETNSGWFNKIPKNTPNWKNVNSHFNKRYEINKKLGLVDYGKAYYAIVSDLHDTYNSLSEIFSLQEMLDQKNIKYLFTYVNKDVMTGLMGFHKNDTNRIDKFTNSLRHNIKFNEWYKFPSDVWYEYFGFDDWAKQNKYEYATSHPLHKAHEDAAELIYDQISNFRR